MELDTPRGRLRCLPDWSKSEMPLNIEAIPGQMSINSPLATVTTSQVAPASRKSTGLILPSLVCGICKTFKAESAAHINYHGKGI